MLFIKSKTDSKRVTEISSSSNSGSSNSNNSNKTKTKTKCNNLKFLTSDLSLFLEQTPLEIVNDYQIVDENLDITLNIYRSNEIINNEVINNEVIRDQRKSDKSRDKSKDKSRNKNIPPKIDKNFKNGLLNFNYSPPSIHYYSIYTESIQKVILNTSKGNNLIFIYLQEVIEEEKEEKEIQSEEERNSKRLKASNVTKDLFKWDRKEIEKISRLY